MKRLLVVLFLILPASLFAQGNVKYLANPIQVEVKTSGNQTIFNVKKEEFGKFSIVLKFEWKGMSRMRDVYKVMDKEVMEVARFVADSTGNDIEGWTWQYHYGELNPKFDPRFVYRMPLDGMREVFTERDNTRCMFRHHDGDTVKAARKGMVVRITKPKEETSGGIVVEHKDGTRAVYQCNDDLIPLVKLGAEVNPTDPLAIARKSQPGVGIVALMIYYSSAELDRDKLPIMDKVEYKYLRPYFSTDKGVVQLEGNQKYEAADDQELITREMSKREAKRWLERKKR